MNKVKQSQAVYSAITSVLAESNVRFEDGMNAREMLTDEMRGQVKTILEAGFESGTIEYASEKPRPKDYVSGLVSNWLRKDPRLNGGTKYTPKNPGSRAGSNDDQVKALRALLSQTTDAAAKTEIQGFLDARLAQLSAAKAKVVTIDVNSLPEELRAKYIAGRNS